MRRSLIVACLGGWFAAGMVYALAAQPTARIDIPDGLIAEAYEKAALQNVLACVNDSVFPGYFSVCADGRSFGYGYTYPSIDGHQLTDALLMLDQLETVLLNWDYVRSFQRPDGQLPLAIFPDRKGGIIGARGFNAPVDSNGGFYRHWVPNDPLRAASSTTYIQNADVIFRHTGDVEWLRAQIGSINLAADFLASLVSPEGAVAGAGYYVERPARVEYDGVAQCYAYDAFHRVAALNGLLGRKRDEKKYYALGYRVSGYFCREFWTGTQCVEYINPTRGKITSHGLTDVDWTALATNIFPYDVRTGIGFVPSKPSNSDILWEQVRSDTAFYYAGMPTGICTRPEAYEKWEFTFEDTQDLAAMGRVWYAEAWARRNNRDADGLVDGLRRVAEKGRQKGYYWRERYNAQGGYGAKTYCEYPANLIRIVQRFLLGVEHRLDGSLMIEPLVPESYWAQGFGQRLCWNGRVLDYRMKRGEITGTYSGPETQRMSVYLDGYSGNYGPETIVTINGQSVKFPMFGGYVLLPASPADAPCTFTIQRIQR